MPHPFKIWNQSNDGKTMAIRCESTTSLADLASQYMVPSDDGVYTSLQEFINRLNTATSPLPPYRRAVDVYWNTAIGYGAPRLFADRTLEATYTGNQRQGGGFAAQCYVMIDPDGFQALGPLHLAPITVTIILGGPRDLLVVTV